MDLHEPGPNRPATNASSGDITNLHTPRDIPLVTAEDIQRAIENDYGLAVTGAPSAVDGYWDFNFDALTSAGAVFCKVYTHDSHLDAQFHADVMNTLAEEGLPTAEVFRNRNGQTVSSIAGMPFIVQRRLPGVPLSELPTTSARIFDLGKTLGQIHNAADGRRFQGNHTKITSWDPRQRDLLFSRYEGAVERFSPHARKHLDALQRKTNLLREELDDLPQGVIHGDYHPGNVLGFEKGISGVVDFSEAMRSWTVADVGICLSYLMGEPHSRFITAAHFLTGYCEEAPLSRPELALLPTVIQLRAATRAIETKLDGGVAQNAEIELIEYFNRNSVEDKWIAAFCS
jgi:Ser/Thr protein kinase RdoA (MazF antagonist)